MLRCWEYTLPKGDSWEIVRAGGGGGGEGVGGGAGVDSWDKFGDGGTGRNTGSKTGVLSGDSWEGPPVSTADLGDL